MNSQRKGSSHNPAVGRLGPPRGKRRAFAPSRFLRRGAWVPAGTRREASGARHPCPPPPGEELPARGLPPGEELPARGLPPGEVWGRRLGCLCPVLPRGLCASRSSPVSSSASLAGAPGPASRQGWVSTPILQFGGSRQKVLLGTGPGSSSHHHILPPSVTKQLAHTHRVDKWTDGWAGRRRVPLHGRGVAVKDALTVYASAPCFRYVPSSKPSPQRSRKCCLCLHLQPKLAS